MRPQYVHCALCTKKFVTCVINQNSNSCSSSKSFLKGNKKLNTNSKCDVKLVVVCLLKRPKIESYCRNFLLIGNKVLKNQTLVLEYYIVNSY